MLGAITQEKLDEQRGVVQNEKRQGENRPYGVTRELIVKNTYPAGHPYSWTVIGSMEDLNAAQLEDVREWYLNPSCYPLLFPFHNDASVLLSIVTEVCTLNKPSKKIFPLSSDVCVRIPLLPSILSTLIIWRKGEKTMKPHQATTFLFSLLCLPTLAMASSTGLEDMISQIDIPYQRFVLDNGLTLIVHEDHKVPIVAVNVWYHVGSKDESPGRSGFAHLFEHLMFNGSEHFDNDYFLALERT